MTFPTTARRRPGDEPMFVRSRRPDASNAPTTEDHLASIDARLSALEGMVLADLAARLDGKDA
jgi:hypothetical protein